MTTTIIGVGNIGSPLARHLVQHGEPVVLAAQDESHAEALADELGDLASAASVRDAIAAGDAVVLATWLEQDRGLVPEIADLLDGKVVIDPSNPVGYDDGKPVRTLPAGVSSGSVVAGLLPDRRSLREGVRDAQRRVVRRRGRSRPTARRHVLCDRRCGCRDGSRTPDHRCRVRSGPGWRRCRRGPLGGSRRRPSPERRTERAGHRSRRSTRSRRCSRAACRIGIASSPQ